MERLFGVRLQPCGSALSSVATISFAEDMNPRFRSTMEDAHCVVDGFGGDPGTGYFGIYDGHGGRNVAEYLRLHLHNNVERELREKGDRSVEECLKSAFLLTDIECAETGEQASGSTAIVCMVRRQAAKRYVYTANVGDARAVLCHAGVAVRLSKDHKATDAAERARIEAAGGFVIRKRVMGVLAVARSFGDFVLKKFVPAEPYTSTTKLDGMVSQSVRLRQSDFVNSSLRCGAEDGGGRRVAGDVLLRQWEHRRCCCIRLRRDGCYLAHTVCHCVLPLRLPSATLHGAASSRA